MTDLRKAAEMALEVFDGPVLKDATEHAMRLRKACDLLRQALAQHADAVNISQKRVDKTAKGKHKWVGLTDDERKQIVSYIRDPIDWVPAVEAKLKEKNGG